jgi:hypothetical protein
VARLYKRRFELRVGDSGEYLTVGDGDTNLRVWFSVEHKYNGYQSLAEISIYNLSRASEQKVFDQYRSITLQAGYRELFGPIFAGQIINVQRSREGVDRVTKMFCRAGGRAIATTTANRTFAANTSMLDAISYCAGLFGFPVDFVGQWNDLPLAIGGYMISGDARARLAELSIAYGFSWIIENGVMVLIRGQASRDGDVYVLRSDTGMIGSPEVTEVGIEVEAALNPVVKIGRRIRVDSASPQLTFSGVYWRNVKQTIGVGEYAVNAVMHQGDTHGDMWRSRFSCWRNS